MSEGMRQRKKQSNFDDDAPHGSSSRKRWEKTLESLDLYAKVEEEDKERTSTGAGMSLLSLAVIALLIFSELRSWLTVKRAEHMKVDAVVEGRVKINFDLTLHALPCDQVNLDAMDVAGEQQNGVDHDFLKVRLALDGTPLDSSPLVGSLPERRALSLPSLSPSPLPPDYCGPCYGSKDGCCNSCDEVRNAYVAKGWDAGEIGRSSEQCVREGRAHEGGAHRLALGPSAGSSEGCRLSGHLQVNKVAGNFHIAMGETHQRGSGHIHQFNPSAIGFYNVTHTIHTLSFGEAFPGQSNPLDGVRKSPEEGSAVYMYYVKVIPTEYSGMGGASPLSTFQYSVSSQFRPAVLNGVRQNILPGLFFVYEMSPFMVTVTESRVGTFLHFLTGLCAILGGVITLARLTDSIIHASTQALGGKVAVSSAGSGLMGGMKQSLVKAAAAVVSPMSVGVSGPVGGLSMNSDILRSPQHMAAIPIAKDA